MFILQFNMYLYHVAFCCLAFALLAFSRICLVRLLPKTTAWPDDTTQSQNGTEIIWRVSRLDRATDSLHLLSTTQGLLNNNNNTHSNQDLLSVVWESQTWKRIRFHFIACRKYEWATRIWMCPVFADFSSTPRWNYVRKISCCWPSLYCTLKKTSLCIWSTCLSENWLLCLFSLTQFI